VSAVTIAVTIPVTIAVTIPVTIPVTIAVTIPVTIAVTIAVTIPVTIAVAIAVTIPVCSMLSPSLSVQCHLHLKASYRAYLSSWRRTAFAVVSSTTTRCWMLLINKRDTRTTSASVCSLLQMAAWRVVLLASTG
jgi:ABC-type transport system involved in cytochrome bd biosynthesis fused ATPase/permease subunit